MHKDHVVRKREQFQTHTQDYSLIYWKARGKKQPRSKCYKGEWFRSREGNVFNMFKGEKGGLIVQNSGQSLERERDRERPSAISHPGLRELAIPVLQAQDLQGVVNMKEITNMDWWSPQELVQKVTEHKRGRKWELRVLTAFNRDFKGLPANA